MMHKNTFWSPFIFCGRSAWEPASIIWDDEQGDLFSSTGPHKNLHYALSTANTGKPQEVLEKKMKVNRPERDKLATKKFWAVGVAETVSYRSTPGFKPPKRKAYSATSDHHKCNQKKRWYNTPRQLPVFLLLPRPLSFTSNTTLLPVSVAPMPLII